MNVVINSAVQSPLFRNLSHIPADRTAFTHHISQNCPPLSIEKISVEPESNPGDIDATYKFRVPQFGYLNKVVLKLQYDIYPVQRCHVTPVLPLYHMVQEISLRSHHRTIQTVYGKECLIKHAYFSGVVDGATKIMGTLNIPVDGTDSLSLAQLFQDESGRLLRATDSDAWVSRKRTITFFLEVPLASTRAPHVNFDTRFVEHLDLYVKMQSSDLNQQLFQAACLMEQDMHMNHWADGSTTDDFAGSGLLKDLATKLYGEVTTLQIGNQDSADLDLQANGTDGAIVKLPNVADNNRVCFLNDTNFTVAQAGSTAKTQGMTRFNKATGVDRVASLGDGSLAFTRPRWQRVGSVDWSGDLLKGWINRQDGKNTTIDTGNGTAFARPDVKRIIGAGGDYFPLDSNNAFSSHGIMSDSSQNGKFGSTSVANEHGNDEAGNAITDDDIYNEADSKSSYTRAQTFKAITEELFYSRFPYMNYNGIEKQIYDGTKPNGRATENLQTQPAAGTSFSSDILVMGGAGAPIASKSVGSKFTGKLHVPSDVKPTLMCTFVNYHDKIREEISMENYKDDQPATVLQYDTQEEYGGEYYGSTRSTRQTIPGKTMILPIKSNHLAYAISVIAFRDRSDKELVNMATFRNDMVDPSQGDSVNSNDFNDGRRQSIGLQSRDQSWVGGEESQMIAMRPTTRSQMTVPWPAYKVVENFKTVKPTHLVLKGSGRNLYELGADAEYSTLSTVPANTQGVVMRGAGSLLSENQLDNLGMKYNDTAGQGPLTGPFNMIDQLLRDSEAISGNLGDNASATVINFSLNPTDELSNSGCLALQPVNNPTLELSFSEPCRVYVYVHHYCLVQIDSNTGTITRSLDV